MQCHQISPPRYFPAALIEQNDGKGNASIWGWLCFIGRWLFSSQSSSLLDQLSECDVPLKVNFQEQRHGHGDCKILEGKDQVLSSFDTHPIPTSLTHDECGWIWCCPESEGLQCVYCPDSPGGLTCLPTPHPPYPLPRTYLPLPGFNLTLPNEAWKRASSRTSQRPDLSRWPSDHPQSQPGPLPPSETCHKARAMFLLSDTYSWN